MLLSCLMILFGSSLLYIGAEVLLRHSIAIARLCKVPKVVIGLTLVAFVTAVPEALCSIFGQIHGGTGDIALGTVLGSNSARIGLILGIYLLLLPSHVTFHLKWRWMPTLLFVYFLIFLVMLGGTIHYLEGLFLLIALSLYLFLQYYLPPKREELKEEAKGVSEKKRRGLSFSIPAVIGSLFLLVGGSNFLIEGAIDVALFFSLSERVISLTVITIGSSLPTLITAIVGAFHKENGVVIGGIIGSNIFNPLLILPCASFIKPIQFAPQLLTIDFPVMLGFALLLWLFMFGKKGHFRRVQGAILLSCYALYFLLILI